MLGRRAARLTAVSVCAVLGAAAAPSVAAPHADSPVPLPSPAPVRSCFHALPGDYAEPLPGRFPMAYVHRHLTLVVVGPGARAKPRTCLGAIVPLGVPAH